jgi:hypothetical protein
VSTHSPCSILNEWVPLAGTAPTSESWLIVIHQGPWGERPLNTLISQGLTMWAAEHEAKLLLARTPKGVDPYPASTFLYATRHGELLIGTLNSEGLPDLAFTQHSKPLLLICTNGKRDQCCATFGRDLIAASKELLPPDLSDQILECSHLGGHRFAPTAIWVPDNLVLGRLNPRAVANLLEHGAIGSQFIRGDSKLTPAQQIVHASVWPQKPLFESSEQKDTEHHITAVVNGIRQMFTVTTTIVETVASCGADPKSSTQYQLKEKI